jgi:osmotically-inducible protein OsmY
MERKRVRRVPVVSAERLVGIVSRADLLRALFTTLDQKAPAPTGDAALRAQVIEELRRQNWGGRSRVSVVVADGVVYLEGFIYDFRERNAMRVAAENVSGVKEVRDHIDYLDQSLGLAYGL